jgi:hypothetical protein
MLVQNLVDDPGFSRKKVWSTQTAFSHKRRETAPKSLLLIIEILKHGVLTSAFAVTHSSSQYAGHSEVLE